MAQDIIAQLGYLGIVAALILGGLGFPIPEEAPVILGGLFAQRGRLDPSLAFAASLLGVLVGDFVVYGLGYWHGERVLNRPSIRRVVSPDRERRFQGHFRRHGLKILMLCRFAPGIRSVAYLTAGILRLPPGRMLAFDLLAASVSTTILFGLGYLGARWIEGSMGQVGKVGLLVAAVIITSSFAVALIRSRRPRKPDILDTPAPTATEPA